MSHAAEKTDAYKLGYSISMFENIIWHLGAAAAQRAAADDKIIADHIDSALASARAGLRLLHIQQRQEP